MSCRSILVVCNFSLPLPGAPWRRIEYLASFLSERGMRVDVIGALQLCRSLKSIFKYARGIAYTNFKIFNIQLRIDIPNWIVGIFNLLGAFPILVISLVKRPGIILVSLPHIEPLPLAYIVAKLLKSKLIVDLRDPLEYWSQWTKGLTRVFYSFLVTLNYALMRKADLTLAVTPGLVRMLAKRGVRAHLVENGADTRVFQPYYSYETREKLGLNSDEVVLVFNGRLGNYYDITPLLYAIAKLPSEVKRKARLLLIGGFWDPAYARKFLDTVRKLRLQSSVKVLKPVQDARTLTEILSAANVGVIARVTSELFDPAIPAKFYEYLACGLPVLALVRRGSELWELIVKWRVGFACEPDDHDCIVSTLKRVFDENLMKDIRANVLRARPLIDRSRAAERLYSMICELLEPKRESPDPERSASSSL